MITVWLAPATERPIGGTSDFVEGSCTGMVCPEAVKVTTGVGTVERGIYFLRARRWRCWRRVILGALIMEATTARSRR